MHKAHNSPAINTLETEESNWSERECQPFLWPAAATYAMEDSEHS